MISGLTIIEHVIAFAPVVLFTFALFLFSYNTSLIYPLAISMFNALVFGVAGMLIIGTLQQVGILQLDMEADSLIGGIVRPASITGSYLHYPLILALAFFIFNQAYTMTESKKYLTMSVLTFLGCLISLSRSGAMIIILGLLLFLAQNTKHLFKAKIAKRLIIVLPIISLIPVLLQPIMHLLDIDSDILIFIWDRLSGGISFESAGNAERLENWSSAFALFLEGPILLGSAFGLLSNAGQNFGISHYGVAESGGLQILTSFGVIGFIAYYASWFKLWRQISIEHHWLRGGFIAAIIQTTVYQSTEVIPFISLLIMFPIISKSIRPFSTKSQIKDHENW